MSRFDEDNSYGVMVCDGALLRQSTIYISRFLSQQRSHGDWKLWLWMFVNNKRERRACKRPSGELSLRFLDSSQSQSCWTVGFRCLLTHLMLQEHAAQSRRGKTRQFPRERGGCGGGRGLVSQLIFKQPLSCWHVECILECRPCSLENKLLCVL